MRSIYTHNASVMLLLNVRPAYEFRRGFCTSVLFIFLAPSYTMARKRPFDEVDNFETVQDPLPSATVHGILTSLSPIKKDEVRSILMGH